MLDAHQLNVFLVAAETLNFTQTAKKLHMTQPSVSQHIQALEKHFNIPLFLRKGRHLDLSDAGKNLLPLARNLVKMSINIEDTMESLKGGVYGHLMVGCGTSPGKYILPRILTNFHKEHSQVKVTCNVTNQTDAIRMLSEGEVHIGLSSEKLENSNYIEFDKFLTDPVELIVPLNHPWARKKVIEPEELFEGEFIMREETSGTFRAVQAALFERGLDIAKLKILLTVSNSEAIALSVQEGLGAGFVSKLVVSRFTRNCAATVKIKGISISQNIYLGFQKRYPESAAQKAFWAFARKINLEKSVDFYSRSEVFMNVMENLATV